MARNQILHGDARELATTLPDDSIHCIVTSPPYFGLRDYGVDGQMGLEQSPDEYVAEMVALFRELRRVLREDGTCWLNLGDSYAGSSNSGGTGNRVGGGVPYRIEQLPSKNSGLASKQLLGIPWRVALALQADGWYLRSDIILAKANPMPESVTDRPTRSHEYVFLLTKNAKYFYDAVAIQESAAESTKARASLGQRPLTPKTVSMIEKGMHGQTDTLQVYDRPNRNKRTVWNVATRPYPEAHFATFNPDWIRPMILAGTSARGVCPACLSPYERVVEKPDMSQRPVRSDNAKYPTNGTVFSDDGGGTRKSAGQKYQEWRNENPDLTTGWQPTCSCDAGDPIPAIVLDPFMGSGTTAAVCVETGRDWLGFELNADYIELAYRRIHGAQPALFAQGA